MASGKMKIESVDFFYLSMPEVLDIGDGSQDALLVRLQAGNHVGWGECEAAPLVSIASLVCPMSHSACKPIQDSVLGQRLDGTGDIVRIGNLVRENSLDLLQTDHTLSGIDIAMWDLLGHQLQAPVYQLLGYQYAYPKTPYASVLFGDTPEQTLEKGRQMRRRGYRAGKFGWGNFGHGTVQSDIEQVRAAREGLGEDGILLIDAGTIWIDDVQPAKLRIEVLKDCGVTWLEEPFIPTDVHNYTKLRSVSNVPIAGGEALNQMLEFDLYKDMKAVDIIQPDVTNSGGIKECAEIVSKFGSKNTAMHVWGSQVAINANKHFAKAFNVSFLEVPMMELEINDHIKHKGPGIGINITEIVKQKYQLKPRINFKIK